MNRFAITSTQVLVHGRLKTAVLVVEDGKIVEIADSISALKDRPKEVRDFGELAILPGIVDSHVHINEPGRTDWEGFLTATKAAAAGGITTLIDMPLNCIPVTTSKAAFETKLAAIRDKLWVDTGFWGGVTPLSLSDLPDLVKSGVLGVKSFLIDSGIEEFPPMRESHLREAIPILKAAGLPYLFHAEMDLTSAPAAKSGTVYAAFEKSRPPEWENQAIEMLLKLCEETGCKTHIVHLSSSDRLPEIAKAKAKGLPFSVETCPHYLCLTSEQIDAEAAPESKPLFKCCPPIRGEKNRAKLWKGIQDGTIDLVVSDHSPCTANLKKLDTGNLDEAWGGIASLQWTLPLFWTDAHARNIPLGAVSHLLSGGPAKMAGLSDRKGQIALGLDADFVIFDPNARQTLLREDILFKNPISPYIGREVLGRVNHTFLRGQEIYSANTPLKSTKPLGAPLLKR